MRAKVARSLLGMIVFFLQFSLLINTAFSEEGVTVVRNKDEGIWDKDRSHHLEFMKTLTIASDEKNKDAVFGKISGIATDSRFNIYAIDFSNRRVMVFDSLGSFMFSFGRPGNGPGEFTFPTAIAIDQHDNIFVADRNGINVFDTNGEYITLLPVKATGMIRDMAIDSEGNFYLCWFEPLEQDIIHKYSAQGEHVKSFCKSYARGQDVDVRIESMFAGGYVDIEKNGDVVFSQLIPYEIRRYSPEGVLKTSVYRDNSFIRKPEEFVKVDGERTEFSIPTASSGILTLPGDCFVNCAFIPEIAEQKAYSVVDLFNANGQFLTSMQFDYQIFFKCKDRLERVYGVASDDMPTIVRFALMIR